jgi:dTDP-4-dehydrorhamnose reductase
MARLAAERTELRIVADQWGAPTSARVIADTVCKLLTRGGIGPGCFSKEHPDTLHVTSSGETSWHGFATAIVEGLRKRDVDIKAERIEPIASDQFPTKAVRPANSRLSLGQLRKVFGLDTLSWQEALEIELDELADLRRARLERVPAGAKVSAIEKVK